MLVFVFLFDNFIFLLFLKDNLGGGKCYETEKREERATKSREKLQKIKKKFKKIK